MGLNYVIGAAGSGKTTFCKKCIKKTAENTPDKKIFYIVPEQFTLNGEYIITELLGGAIMNTDVVSFKRLAYNVFSEVGIDDFPILDAVGKNIVLRRIINELHENNELKYFDKATSKTGFIERISSTVSEFVHYMITDEKLDILIDDAKERTGETNALVLKYQDLKLIFDRYNEFIFGKYISAENTPDYLAGYIKKSKRLDGAEVYIDSFSGFSPQEISVITALLHKCAQVYVTLSVPHTGESRDGFYCEPASAILRLNRVCAEENISCTTAFNGGKTNKRQKGVLREFSENYLTFNREVLESKNDGSICIIKADTMYSEIRYAANEINTLIYGEKASYSEIAVILGNTDYLPTVKNIFRKFEIAFFADNKISASSHPLAQLIISFLKVYIYDFRYEDVFNMLKTGFFEGYEDLDGDSIYELENYVLEYAKNGAQQYKTEWLNRNAYKNTEAVRRIICSLLIEDSKIRMLNGKKGYKYKTEKISEKIFEFLGKINVSATLLNWSGHNENIFVNSAVHKQVFDLIKNTMGKIDEILGGTKITVKDYCDIFSDALKSITIGFIPSKLDQLPVGDIDRSRFTDIKYLFILGANEGCLPASVKDLGLLSDEERAFAREKGILLAADSEHIVKHNEFLIYSALSIPKERLYICYCTSTLTGESYLPSPVVKRILMQCDGTEEITVTRDDTYISSQNTALEAFFENIKKKPKATETQALFSVLSEKYPYFTNMVCSAVMKLKQRDNLIGEISEDFINRKFSVSQIETFNSCHFRYFASYILNLRKRRKGEIGFDTVGTAQHGLLQRIFEFMYRALETGEFKQSDITDENGTDLYKLQKIMNVFFEKAALDYKNSEEYKEAAFDITGKNSHIFNRIEKIVRITASAIAANLIETGFKPYKTEFNFDNEKQHFKIKLDDGREIKFGGKIDRIDTYNDDNGDKYVRIVDYKSSEKDLNMADIELGIQIQLLTYLSAFLKIKRKEPGYENVKPAGAFYMKVYENAIDSSDVSESIEDDIKKMRSGYRLNGIITDNAQVKELMNGTVSDKCFVENEAGFEELFKKVERNIKTACQEIIKGNISITPVVNSKDNESCKYCEYYPLCNRDFMEEEN